MCFLEKKIEPEVVNISVGHCISGLKSQLLKLSFLSKKDGEKWSRILYYRMSPIGGVYYYSYFITEW